MGVGGTQQPWPGALSGVHTEGQRRPPLPFGTARVGRRKRHLLTCPVVVGRGTRLFPTTGSETGLELDDLQSTPKGGGLTATVATVGIRQYASASDAAESFTAMEKALETCHQETYQGSVLKYSPMSVDKLGDQSLGVRIDSDGTTLLQQFTLDGPTLINVGTGGLTNAEADTATKLLRDQVDRYEAAARK
ncbi:hypothetical protein GCM10017776_53730 [Streptomyces griseoluteus]|nr:hypothetical protein GCM10017776_53730 [Streptomyces griseoluteus]